MTHAHFVLLATLYGVHPASIQQGGEASPEDIERWAAIAEETERAGIDAFFLADAPSAGREGSRVGNFEPLTLLAALSRETSRLGLVATASTSFNEPYNLARQFASLNTLSNGRAGWNSVTTSQPDAAANFGDTQWADHDRRYRVATEFTDIVLRLWEAEDTPIDHVGDHFAVRGPLNIPATADNRPLITQAGGSPDGIALAGRYADATFAITADLAAAAEYRDRIRTAEVASGRPAGSVKILPGIVPYLADTLDEAAAYKARLDGAVDPEPFYRVVARYLHLAEAELRTFPLDGPFPVEVLKDPAEVDNSVATYTSLKRTIENEGLTVRQTLIKTSGGNRHREFVGTPETFVAELEAWLEVGAGFALLLPSTERDLTFFADRVTPLLRARGLLPDTYPTASLRERFRT